MISVLKRHKIHPLFWQEFLRLAEAVAERSPEFRTRLDCLANYQEALKDILAQSTQTEICQKA